MLRLRRGIVNKRSDSNSILNIQSSSSKFLDCIRTVPQIRRKVSMNSTVNGSSESWSCFAELNSTASKIGGTITYCLIIIVSLAANSLIVMIVYRTPNIREPINYFIANMASPDLLIPIFWIPRNLSYLHTNYLFSYRW